MEWILNINIDVLPLIAPNVAPTYHKLIPKRLVKRLGDYDPERWTRVLRNHRVDLIINEHKFDIAVVGEYDEERDSILIQITNPKAPNLVFQLIQAIMHETIHADQFARDKKYYYARTCPKTDNDHINYLTLKGEVEAFAHCLLLESMDEPDLSLCPTMKMYDDVPEKSKRTLLKYMKDWRKVYKDF